MYTGKLILNLFLISSLVLISLSDINCSYAPPQAEIEEKSKTIGLYEEWLMGLIALKNIRTPLHNPKGNLSPLEKKYRLILKKLHYSATHLKIWRDTYMPPEVIIYKSKAKNAFTLPGGFICITTGIIDKAKKTNKKRAEGMIAAILAHELCHLYLEHPKKHYITMLLKDNISRQYREMAEGIQAASGDFTTDYSKLIIATILKAKEAGTKGYQASMEFEADINAVSVLDKAGFNPYYLVDVMGLFKSHMGGVHGSYQDRVSRVKKAIKKLKTNR